MAPEGSGETRHRTVTPNPDMKVAILFAGIVACAVTPLIFGAEAPAARSFGRLPDGREVTLYSLRSAGGFGADIADYGGTIVRLIAPDRSGKLADVALGFGSAEPYADKSPYFGAVIGRVGNRIARGQFTLDGQRFELATNNSPGNQPCHLHGGKVGFDKVVWRGEPSRDFHQSSLRTIYGPDDLVDPDRCLERLRF